MEQQHAEKIKKLLAFWLANDQGTKKSLTKVQAEFVVRSRLNAVKMSLAGCDNEFLELLEEKSISQQRKLGKNQDD